MTLRMPLASILLVLALLMTACGGAEDPAASTTDSSEDAGGDDVADDDDELVASEDPVDPEPTDDVAFDDATCDSVAGIIQLIGEAAAAEPLGEQQVDAIELMGQTIADLQDQGAPPEVVQAASDIHDEFAEIINSGGEYEPDLTVVGAATDALRPLVESCGITGDDVGANDSGNGYEADGDADAVASAEVDPDTCVLTSDFVNAASDFAQAEIGSEEEQDAVSRMESAAFAFADGAVVEEDVSQAVFELFESAQSFLETGETGDVQAQGELVDALFNDCVDAGLAEAL